MLGPRALDEERCFCPQACLRTMILPSGYDLALGLTPSGQIIALRQNHSPQISPQAKASPSVWALGPSMIFIQSNINCRGAMSFILHPYRCFRQTETQTNINVFGLLEWRGHITLIYLFLFVQFFSVILFSYWRIFISHLKPKQQIRNITSTCQQTDIINMFEISGCPQWRKIIGGRPEWDV